MTIPHRHRHGGDISPVSRGSFPAVLLWWTLLLAVSLSLWAAIIYAAAKLFGRFMCV